MKEPDKVYVSIGYEAQTKPFHTSVEYIRKDALLEWAKEKRAALLNCDATEERKVAALSVCDAFIKKIKSL